MIQPWKYIVKQNQNSIGQIFVEAAVYDYDRPYRSPSTESFRGSSFVIKVIGNEIYLLTNAHVVENAIDIQVRFSNSGKRDIPCELVSFCYFKDLALLKVVDQQLSNLIQPVEFADSIFVQQTDPVLAAGFPLGEENIQFTTGEISGFHVPNKDLTDKGMKCTPNSNDQISPAFFQITAAINPGSSGGPLFNNDGKVIGINAAGCLQAQSVGYAIRSRTIFSVLPAMFQSPFLYQPDFGFDWNPANCGIYIRDVYPTSFLTAQPDYTDSLSDELDSIDQSLREWGSAGQQIADRLNLVQPSKSNALLPGDILYCIQIDLNSTKQLTFNLDNFGQATTSDLEINRNFSLQEIMDMIPIGSVVRMGVFRKDLNLELAGIFTAQPVSQWMVRKIYPRFEPDRFAYFIFAGLCLAQLAEGFKLSDKECLDSWPKFKKFLVVTSVFGGTSLDQLHSVRRGDLLTQINGEKVQTLAELKRILNTSLSKPTIELQFQNRTRLVLDLNRILSEDADLAAKYNFSLP